MRILVTNDDGLHAPGLIHLVRFCRKMGEVTTIVPLVEQSGKSHGIELKKSFKVHEVELEPGIMAYAVESTPADCVRYGVLARGMKFDLVISGINRGYNLGVDSLYSGTVAAAREAALHGIPAIALVGNIGEGAEQIVNYGITSIVKTAPDGMPLAEALARAEELYFDAAVSLFHKF